MSGQFLFMADAHVKNRTWTNSLQLTGDAYAALDRVVKQLSDRKRLPVTLVIGGDWFDSNRPSSSDILRTNYFLDQFRYVYFIAGNHDNVEPSFLSAFSCNRTVMVKQLTEVPIKMPELDGVWIAGVNWMSSGEKLQQIVRQICTNWQQEHSADDVLYLVLHTSFQHLLAFDGAYKLTDEFIRSVIGAHNIRVLVGDIHTRDVLQLDHPGQYIHSPGSLYPLSIDQIGNQCAVSLIDAKTGAIEDVPAKVRSYRVLEYTSPDVVDVALEEYKHSPDYTRDLLSPFIRLIVANDADVRIDTSKYTDVVLQVMRASAAAEEASHITSAAGCTILQAALEETDGDELLAQLVEALLAADDPLEEINGWLKFWKVKQDETGAE